MYLTISEQWGSCGAVYLRSGRSLKEGLGAGIRLPSPQQPGTSGAHLSFLSFLGFVSPCIPGGEMKEGEIKCRL